MAAQTVALKILDSNGTEITEFDENKAIRIEAYLLDDERAAEAITVNGKVSFRGETYDFGEIIIPQGASSSTVDFAQASNDYYVDKGDIKAYITSAISSVEDDNGDVVTINHIIETDENHPQSVSISDIENTTEVKLYRVDSNGDNDGQVDENSDEIKFKIRLTKEPKVTTTVTVEVEGESYDLVFNPANKTYTNENSGYVYQILSVSKEKLHSKLEEDVYTESLSVKAVITKIKEGNHEAETTITGDQEGEYEKLSVTRKEAIDTIIDTETPVHVDLTATTPTSEDNGSITYTASLREADLSDSELAYHKGVKVTLEDGTIINIEEGQRSGTATIAVHRDDIYKESDTVTNKIIKVENLISGDGAFEKLVENSAVVTTVIEDDSDRINVTIIQVKEDGSEFAEGEDKAITEGESAFYKVLAMHADSNNVNSPDPIEGTVDVKFTNGGATTSNDDYTIVGGTLDDDNILKDVAFGSTIEVKATLDSDTNEGEEYFYLALVDKSAKPTNPSVSSSEFEDANLVCDIKTYIKDGRIPVDIKLVPTDKDGNILDKSEVIESKNAYYKVALFKAGTEEEVVDNYGGKATVSITEASAKESEDYINQMYLIDGSEVENKRVDIGTVFYIKTVDNLLDERDETYTLSMINSDFSSQKYTIVSYRRDVETTIEDDNDSIMIGLEQVKDAAGTAFAVGESKTVKEGEKAYYKVNATKGSENDVAETIQGSVDVKFDGLSSGDYDKSGQTVHVNFGDVISTDIVDDNVHEDDETFSVSLVEGSAKPTESGKDFEDVSLASAITTKIEDDDPSNLPPLDAKADCLFVDQGKSQIINVLENDSGDEIEIFDLSTPEHGSVEIIDGKNIKYTADPIPTTTHTEIDEDTGLAVEVKDAPFVGTDRFTYEIKDKYNQTKSAVVSPHIVSTSDYRDDYEGTDMSDFVIAGKGDDYLSGGKGNDHYFFSTGDGDDIIHDLAGDDDRIVFTPDMKEGESSLGYTLKDNGDFVVTYGDNDTITVKYQKNSVNEDFGIERIQMDNSHYLKNSDIEKMIQTLSTFDDNASHSLSQINDKREEDNLTQIVWHH